MSVYAFLLISVLNLLPVLQRMLPQLLNLLKWAIIIIGSLVGVGIMYKVLNDIQTTRNFRLSEFECHDGSREVMLDMQLALKLQNLRDALVQPIAIAAGYRNQTHNAKVGGEPDRLHLEGKAADIKVCGRTPKAVAIIAENIGFKGIGVYTHNGNCFIHLVCAPQKGSGMTSQVKFWLSQNM